MIVDKIKLNLCHIIRCDQKSFAICKSQTQITNANRGKFHKTMPITFSKNHDGSHRTGLSKKQSLWRRNFNSFWRSPFWWSHNNLFVNSRCRVMVCIPPSLYQIFYHIFLNLSQYFSTYMGVKILKYDKTFQIDYLSPFLTSGGTMVKISTDFKNNIAVKEGLYIMAYYYLFLLPGESPTLPALADQVP